MSNETVEQAAEAIKRLHPNLTLPNELYVEFFTEGFVAASSDMYTPSEVREIIGKVSERAANAAKPIINSHGQPDIDRQSILSSPFDDFIEKI